MDRYSVESTTLTGIADAIREKTGSSEEIKVEDMAGKIDEIHSGADVNFCTINIINPNGRVGYNYITVKNNLISWLNDSWWGISLSDNSTFNDCIKGGWFTLTWQGFMFDTIDFVIDDNKVRQVYFAHSISGGGTRVFIIPNDAADVINITINSTEFSGDQT